MKKQYTYDGSFEGFLTVIFHIFESKSEAITIDKSGKNEAQLFSSRHEIETSSHRADRVLQGLFDQSSKRIVRFIYTCFLSEKKGVELKLLYLVRHIFRKRAYIISDYSDPIIMDLHKISKMMGREIHRMHAFVRFQETIDNIYTAIISPDFDVLPLIGDHFVKRYSSMEWLIYDVQRNYGIHFLDGKLEQVEFEDAPTLSGGKISSIGLADRELEFQELWKTYFKSVNIEERNNAKLHTRHVPKRYWKYLVEKW